MPQPSQDALAAEYAEASSSFQLLTDIRFKLLAFLPLGTAAAALVGDGLDGGVESLAFSLFGLVVTIGLATYNTRNDQLYDTLVGRLSELERRLGLADGAFANRPRPWLTVGAMRLRWKIDHRRGVATIYFASIALWLFGVFGSLGELARRAWVDLDGPRLFDADAPALLDLAALVLAALVTWLGVRHVHDRKEATQAALRGLARDAVGRAVGTPLAELARDDAFLEACSGLASKPREIVTTRIGFLAGLDGDARSKYVSATDAPAAAAQVVAVVTNLPPEWLYDTALGRHRGTQKPERPPEP